MKKRFFIIAIAVCCTILSLSGCGLVVGTLVEHETGSYVCIAKIKISDAVKIRVIRLEKGEGYSLHAYRNGERFAVAYSPTFDPKTDDAAEAVRYFRTKGIDLLNPPSATAAEPEPEAEPAATKISEIPTLGFR